MSKWANDPCPAPPGWCPWRHLPEEHVVGDHPTPEELNAAIKANQVFEDREWDDPRTTFSPLRISQVLVNSIKADRDPNLVCPTIFYMEDHDFMHRIQAKREQAEVCAECEHAVNASFLCSYECKYDGLPGKPTKMMKRWVLPWEDTDEGA